MRPAGTTRGHSPWCGMASLLAEGCHWQTSWCGSPQGESCCAVWPGASSAFLAGAWSTRGCGRAAQVMPCCTHRCPRARSARGASILPSAPRWARQCRAGKQAALQASWPLPSSGFAHCPGWLGQRRQRRRV
eukprot:11221205-Lingulodinium_polyedra.AAC.1